MKGSKERLFIRTQAHNLYVFGVIPNFVYVFGTCFRTLAVLFQTSFLLLLSSSFFKGVLQLKTNMFHSLRPEFSGPIEQNGSSASKYWSIATFLGFAESNGEIALKEPTESLMSEAYIHRPFSTWSSCCCGVQNLHCSAPSANE